MRGRGVLPAGRLGRTRRHCDRRIALGYCQSGDGPQRLAQKASRDRHPHELRPLERQVADFPVRQVHGALYARLAGRIIVNQAGRRFYNELENGYPNGTHEGFYKDGKPYVHGDWRNATRIDYRPRNYIDAALAINEGSAAPDFSAGPQWAIFDAAAMKRERMRVKADTCDPNLFFQADTIEALAEKINSSTWQKAKMDPKVLAETVARYNGFVEKGKDDDFDKPSPKHAIATGPFYAAWATFAVHDSYAGLRIDGDCRVVDWHGKAIDGLWCGGESAGGCSQHGLGRCLTQGYIIGQRIAGKKA